MRLKPGEIVLALKRNQGKVRQTARELGVSHSTVSFWKKRAVSKHTLKLSSKQLRRKSTEPKSVRATILTLEQQDLVVTTRKESGFCAQKLTGMLELPVSHRTVHRFLQKKDLTQPYRYHRRPRFQDTKHMHAKNTFTLGKLQMDVKYVTPELSGLAHTTFLYAVIDILSRYKLGVILPELDQALSIEALNLLLPLFPFPCDFLQNDNGLEFQQQFHLFVTNQLGLEHHYIHKSTPNENALIERSFRTDEEEFFTFKLHRWGRPDNLLDLNGKYQRFITEYNTIRPHLSLDLKTPNQVVEMYLSH